MLKVKDFDFRQFDAYRRNYANGMDNYSFCDDTEYVLRFWAQNKERLYKLLGNKLIHTLPISYERGKDEMYDEMGYASRGWYDLYQEFMSRLCAKFGLRENGRHPMDMWDRSTNEQERLEKCVLFVRDVRNMLNNSEMLVENRVFSASETVEIDGHTVRFERGEKVVRALGRLAKLLGIPAEQFEAFRVAHGQVLNQKKLTGELCLSIHPLDYATASDNENGWSSCMSWQESGCYRLGTVEMMNSPVVICAYLKSKQTSMHIDGRDWPSKKWRAWIITDGNYIMCERNYPYENTELIRTAMREVARLAAVNLGEDYMDGIKSIDDWNDDNGINVSFETNFMYNDTRDTFPMMVREGVRGFIETFVNYSGEANCMWCGNEIEWRYNDDDAGTLVCESCRPGSHCCECGSFIDEDNQYEGPDGYYYCEDCYNQLFRTCERCGEAMAEEDSNYVMLPIRESTVLEYLRKDGCNERLRDQYRSYREGTDYYAPSTSGVWLCRDCSVNDDGEDAVVHLKKFPYGAYGDEDLRFNADECVFDPNKISEDTARRRFNWNNAMYHGLFHVIWEEYKTHFSQTIETSVDF